MELYDIVKIPESLDNSAFIAKIIAESKHVVPEVCRYYAKRAVEIILDPDVPDQDIEEMIEKAKKDATQRLMVMQEMRKTKG